MISFLVTSFFPLISLAQDATGEANSASSQQQATQAAQQTSSPASGNRTDQTYKLLAPIPEFGKVYTPGDIGKYVNAIVSLAIVVSAVLAVVMITIGGFKYMTSESMSLKEEGKKNIQNAFLGIILLSASYLILNTINPALLNFNLNIEKIGVPGNPNTKPAVNTVEPNSAEQRSIEAINKEVGQTYEIPVSINNTLTRDKRKEYVDNNLLPLCQKEKGPNAELQVRAQAQGETLKYTCVVK